MLKDNKHHDISKISMRLHISISKIFQDIKIGSTRFHQIFMTSMTSMTTIRFPLPWHFHRFAGRAWYDSARWFHCPARPRGRHPTGRVRGKGCTACERWRKDKPKSPVIDIRLSFRHLYLYSYLYIYNIIIIYIYNYNIYIFIYLYLVLCGFVLRSTIELCQLMSNTCV